MALPSAIVSPSIPNAEIGNYYEKLGVMKAQTIGKRVGSNPAGYRLLAIPDLLQRVLSSEMENVCRTSGYLVLAIHAVMLETGFVNSRIAEGFELPSGWSFGGSVDLTYTLPELTRSTGSFLTAWRLGEEVLLRFRIIGDTLVVYGAVARGSAHRLSLSLSNSLVENVKFPKVSQDASNKLDKSAVEDKEPVATIEDENTASSRQAYGGSRGAEIIGDGENIFRDVFGLWREVKDSFTLPLLTAMCETAGLPSPPCLLRLPTELKIKVLDSLVPLSLANISCTCSELRLLAAKEDLWKQRYIEEFGESGATALKDGGWKSSFVRDYNQRKRREELKRKVEAFRGGEDAIYPVGSKLKSIIRPLSNSFAQDCRSLQYFQGWGACPRVFGFPAEIGSGFRGFRAGSSGNPRLPTGNWAAGRQDLVGGAYGDENGMCWPGFDFDGPRLRAWPSLHSSGSRATRSGRFDQTGGRLGADWLW